MQRREFIAAVGVVAAVSQSDLRATYRCRCASHHPRKWDSSPFRRTGRWPRIRFGLERVIRDAAFCSSRANNTNSEAVRARGPALDHTVTIRKYRKE
jgi:hypothetical protein